MYTPVVHTVSISKPRYKRKFSAFCITCFIFFLIAFIAIIAYFFISKAGYIDNLKNLIAEFENTPTDGEQNVTSTENVNSYNRELAKGWVFGIALISVGIYIGSSLYLLFSRKSEEDSRWLSLPIIITPIFLIASNGLLHLLDNKSDENFYTVLIDIIIATVICVDTFASLKFSFQISAQRSRFNESAKFKPEIVLYKNEKSYKIKLNRNSSFLCGILIGNIERFYYWDIKKLGYKYFIDKLIFSDIKIEYLPNTIKKSSDLDKTQDLNISDILKSCGSDTTVEDVLQYAKLNNRNTYLIFRDIQNFYYLALLPEEGCGYDVIEANENVMSRLLCKFNAKQRKYEAKGQNTIHNNKFVKYTCMSIFKIPYNFYPDKVLDN